MSMCYGYCSEIASTIFTVSDVTRIRIRFFLDSFACRSIFIVILGRSKKDFFYWIRDFLWKTPEVISIWNLVHVFERPFNVQEKFLKCFQLPSVMELIVVSKRTNKKLCCVNAAQFYFFRHLEFFIERTGSDIQLKFGTHIRKIFWIVGENSEMFSNPRSSGINYCVEKGNRRRRLKEFFSFLWIFYCDKRKWYRSKIFCTYLKNLFISRKKFELFPTSMNNIIYVIEDVYH